ncbi:MAG: hypothetical protein KC535_04940, partial [Nanoarchaeota archaeon]|nr:hypothetical protein [Nanoarchaeota archaeon]
PHLFPFDNYVFQSLLGRSMKGEEEMTAVMYPVTLKGPVEADTKILIKTPLDKLFLEQVSFYKNIASLFFERQEPEIREYQHHVGQSFSLAYTTGLLVKENYFHFETMKHHLKSYVEHQITGIRRGYQRDVEYLRNAVANYFPDEVITHLSTVLSGNHRLLDDHLVKLYISYMKEVVEESPKRFLDEKKEDITQYLLSQFVLDD